MSDDNNQNDNRLVVSTPPPPVYYKGCVIQLSPRGFLVFFPGDSCRSADTYLPSLLSAYQYIDSGKLHRRGVK